MFSLITSQTQFPSSQHSHSHLNYAVTPFPFHLHTIKKRLKIRIKSSTLATSFGFKELNKGRNFGSSWSCLCKQSEGDVELEAEIMGFMEKSEKPTIFPTKKDLIAAGRWDLVESIKRRGGWFSLGWEDDEEDGNNVDKDSVERGMDNDIDEFQRRVERCKEPVSLRDDDGSSMFYNGEGNELASGVESDMESPSSLRELGAGANASGIEGILSGLEKQRNRDFGINLPKDGHESETSLTSKVDKYGKTLGTSKYVARTDFGDNVKVMTGLYQKDGLNTPNGRTSPSIEPESWRTWSYQRAGFQDVEFEAAEISFREIRVNSDKEINRDGQAVTSERYDEAIDKTKEIDPNDIRVRLQCLEFELTTALSSLRSKKEHNIPEQTIGSSGEMLNLSDAWEFQENEFISAQEKLRSIRVKLAILEGKMALSIIEAQKVVEEKQKRIDGARNALQLLRTTCVVWPNSASEVLLAGSFDGWTTQRKMDKSRSGVFSVYLKLYPGRYEIKFVVDGIWKVDPLRPIVNNNGHDNNLLIVP